MRTRPRSCPECGSPRIAKIVYGLPAKELDTDAVQDPDNPKIFYGGCCVSPGMPRWRCNECGHRWGSVTL